MDSQGDISRFVAELKAGQRDAARLLWERYYHRLLGLARAKLGGLPRRALSPRDEEDVALSAFDSFCRGAEQGRFLRLEDRHDLWEVLVTITTRKAINLIVHEGRDRRDWRRIQDRPEGPDASGSILGTLIGKEPDPGFAAGVADEFERLLALLPDDELKQIALGKLEGYTNEEIREQLDLAPATVERRLRLIRKHWAGEATS
jgi:DNA-directed RNA polymerase specialized sigma24 family protein